MVSSKILVLAGGSVKGAFQTGVIKAVFEAGFTPNAIYGISAGSMNASFLVNEIGKQKSKNKKIDYNKAANKLVDFWKTNITSPGSLARRRGTYELGLSAIRKNFEGLLDTSPLKDILHQNISVENLKESPIGLKVGAVDIMQGGIYYADPNTEHFLDFVMASSAIPILMPVVNIGGSKHHAFLDGGLRDVAPIKKAIYDGADEIVCIACHTKEIEGGYFPYGNLLALVDRTMDIAVNECLNNDLDWVEFFNSVLPNDGSISTDDGPLKGKRKIKLTIIRPLSPLQVDIQNFDELDIERVIGIGYEIGQKAMQK
jgi:NTE family protein